MDDFRPMRVLRLKQVQQLLGLSRSTIYDRLNPKSRRYDATFPKPIRLCEALNGRGSIGFIEDELTSWIEQRITMRSHRLEQASKHLLLGDATREVVK